MIYHQAGEFPHHGNFKFLFLYGAVPKRASIDLIILSIDLIILLLLLSLWGQLFMSFLQPDSSISVDRKKVL